MNINGLVVGFTRENITVDVVLKNNKSTSIKFDLEIYYTPKKLNKQRYKNFEYMYSRIVRIFNVMQFDSMSDAVREIATLILADNRAPFLKIILQNENTENIVFEFDRKKMCFGPSAPLSHLIRAFIVRVKGNIIKILARPFHFLFPNKRWIMQPITEAKKAPKSESGVPRKIWQTNFTDRCSFPIWINHARNLRLSKDFVHHYVSTEEREKYILEHASQRVVEAYKKLNDGAAQADLWRLVTLYEEGGIYMDIDATLLRPLAEIIKDKDYVFLWDRKRFSNFFIATKPKNPIFKEFIDEVLYKIENYDPVKDITVFYVTGPGALERVLDAKIGVKYTPYQSIASQGLFTDEKYQYIDRPNSKWTHNKCFIKN